MTEQAWAESLRNRLDQGLSSLCSDAEKVRVVTQQRLTYAYEIFCYESVTNRPCKSSDSARYATDLLVFDEHLDGSGWTPRVIIECKTERVTTHDALTYSTKAATHKNVHPYVRYGIVIGSYGTTIPARLIRHGAYFDFMGVWEHFEPSEQEWSELVDVLTDEVEASRALQAIQMGRARGKAGYRLLHRPLVLWDARA